MSTLSNEDLKKRKKRKRKVIFILWIIAILLSPIAAEILNGICHGLFKEFGVFRFQFDYMVCLKFLISENNRKVLVIGTYVISACLLSLKTSFLEPQIVETGTREVAKGIYTPVPVGNGQFGTSRFMTEKELTDTFSVAVCDKNGEIKGLSENAGLIISYARKNGKEVITYLSAAVNAIILGATRSGKTRRLLLTSIWLNILAGINMLLVDVKEEIFAYTSKFAIENGYEVRTLNFRDFQISMCFNNLSEIVELLKRNDISDAVDKAWDIVSVLVGEAKGEKIWTDGQCATIAAAILIIAQDAPEECKNLTNVYYFLAYMCESDPETGEMPINDYLDNLPDNHPAKGAFQIAKIAPFRTRSSFFTSALATLRLFTTWNVADITKKSDYIFGDTDEKKVIYYLILPDEKTTYHPIGAIFIKQLYESLVKQAARKGGKLDRRFIFKLEELGNFPVIPAFGTMLSAGAGRNIFFELVIQDYQQIEGKYKDDFRNIRTNCQLTICLKVTDEKTAKEISDRMGAYTVQVNSSSSQMSENYGNNGSSSYSSSSNMTSRPLLFGNEISEISMPDALVLYDGKQAITNLPDISEYYANEAFGMGNEEFNRKLFLERIKEWPARDIGAPKLWGIWNDYGVQNQMFENEEKVSFLE